MSQTNRETLLKKLMLLKPAVSTQTYIPILSHFMFDGDSVTAYNDVAAISVPCDLPAGCVPAELLIKTLNSLSSEFVAIARYSDHMLVTSGRSKIKLPVMQSVDFPFSFKNMKSKLIGSFKMDRTMLVGMKKCLIGVGTDQSHPAQMGITLDPMYSKTDAAFYTTDNVTISRFIFQTDMELPGDMNVIMPTFFCNQLLAMEFTNEDIQVEIHDGGLLAKFSDGTLLFTKTIADLEPMEFTTVINKYIDRDNGKMFDIPDLFDQSFERALLIQASEIYKDTLVTVENEKLTLNSRSKFGEAFDVMAYLGDDIKFHIDPSHVKRISPVTTKVALLPRVMIFADDKQDFIHLIAHRSV